MTHPVLADSPDAVRAYMSLTTGDDHTTAIVSFADAAHVTDDGRDHHGTSEIRKWLDRTSSEYSYTSTPLVARTNGESGRTTVTCRLEGTFPGSPVDLDYRFRLDSAYRISRLEIVVHDPERSFSAG
ncbi:nuclear transport factor 2 family protein [Streptomyces scopuliridis]|uniref:nuclear transport factor 2 family protein n=1 Tax=Streptomyces scopuliridis TaxID=452529 RepID=UPI002DD80348|nr:nuclear transport factor 2 family protein [Streptomyces scopuliridis]WSB35143.1 nuclear transport factor 2 family protein [Streptomyces scopuliridis]